MVLEYLTGPPGLQYPVESVYEFRDEGITDGETVYPYEYVSQGPNMGDQRQLELPGLFAARGWPAPAGGSIGTRAVTHHGNYRVFRQRDRHPHASGSDGDATNDRTGSTRRFRIVFDPESGRSVHHEQRYGERLSGGLWTNRRGRGFDRAVRNRNNWDQLGRCAHFRSGRPGIRTRPGRADIRRSERSGQYRAGHRQSE